MITENTVFNLWKECKEVFLFSYKVQLEELLKNILEIVRRNYNVFKEKTDLQLLDYIVTMDADEYIIGTNGDDFELRLKTYLRQENISVEVIWKILSQLIWDLTVPVTEKICPFCRSDNLALLMDKEEKHVYESCETCFWISEGGIQIMRPADIFPANKKMINKNNNAIHFCANSEDAD